MCLASKLSTTTRSLRALLQYPRAEKRPLGSADAEPRAGHTPPCYTSTLTPITQAFRLRMIHLVLTHVSLIAVCCSNAVFKTKKGLGVTLCKLNYKPGCWGNPISH